MSVLWQVCDSGCEFSSFAAALNISVVGDKIMLFGSSLNGESSINITFPLTITYVIVTLSLLQFLHSCCPI